MKLAKQARTVAVGATIAAVCAVIGFAATAYAKPPFKGCGPDACLDVWRPVICSDGHVYSNSCYAAKACATGCVPYGDTR